MEYSKYWKPQLRYIPRELILAKVIRFQTEFYR